MEGVKSRPHTNPACGIGVGLIRTLAYEINPALPSRRALTNPCVNWAPLRCALRHTRRTAPFYTVLVQYNLSPTNIAGIDVLEKV